MSNAQTELIDRFCKEMLAFEHVCHVESATPRQIIARSATCPHKNVTGVMPGVPLPDVYIFSGDLPPGYYYPGTQAHRLTQWASVQYRDLDAFGYPGEAVLTPAQRARLNEARPAYQIGVDVAAAGEDQTVAVMLAVTAEGRPQLLPGGHVFTAPVKETWRHKLSKWWLRWRYIRSRYYYRYSIDFEPRDWWLGIYGPTTRPGDNDLHLYVGLLLPWVLHLYFGEDDDDAAGN